MMDLISSFTVLCAEMYIEFASYGGTITWKYDHPLVILIAVFVFLLVMNFKFESKLINELAKAVFTSFLFHSALLPHMMVEQFVNGNIFILIAHQFGTAVLLYMVSYIVYKIYSFITAPIFKGTSPIIDKYDISVTD